MSAITAKALNSTLGTGKFRAFDELLRIKAVTAGENTFAYIPDVTGRSVVYETNYNGTGDKTRDWASEEILVFKTTIQGTVNISFDVDVSRGDSNNSVTGLITLYRNGEQVASINDMSVSGDGVLRKNFTPTFNDVAIGLDDTIAVVIGVAYVNNTPSATTTSSIIIKKPIQLKGTLSEYIPIMIHGEV